MKFGMPTLVECKDIFECADVAVKNKLDFIEINMSFPQYQTHSMSTDALVSLAERTGLFYTVHADEQLNPFDFNPSVSECYLGVMRDTIRFAKAVGAPIINMHLLKGVYVTLPGRVVLLTDVYFEDYVTRVRTFIEMCEHEIGDAPLKIAIENVDSNPFTESQQRVLDLFMQSPVFALTLDTGHEMCLGNADSHVFSRYPDKLLHMHLHDSDGRSCHLALGDGILDIPAKLSQLRGDTCLIEVKTVLGLAKSIKFLNFGDKK